jgi:hypothetical protein
MRTAHAVCAFELQAHTLVIVAVCQPPGLDRVWIGLYWRVRAQKGFPVSENVEREELVGKPQELPEAQIEERVDELQDELDEPTIVGKEGAGTVIADTVTVQEGAVQNVEAETVTVQQGAILHAQADAIEIQEGAVGVVQSETVTIHEGAVGVAVGERVEVGQGAVIFAAAQEIGGEAQVMIDVKAALVLGAVMGIVSGLVRALLGRKKKR